MVRAYRDLARVGVPGEVYNVGSERERSIRDLLDALLDLARVPIRVERDPTRFRPLDVPRMVCDATKVRTTTGWKPRIPLEKTLKDILDDWRGKVEIKS